MNILKLKSTHLFCVILLIITTSIVRAQGDNNGLESQLSDVDKLYGLSCFWSEAKHRFVYFDQVPDLDWDKTYRDFIPQVLSTKSTYEYYRVIQRFCSLLKDGHTHVYYPQACFIIGYIGIITQDINPLRITGRIIHAFQVR